MTRSTASNLPATDAAADLELRLFKTLWGHTAPFAAAVEDAVEHGFNGIEGPVPLNPSEAREWKQQLDDAGLELIAEIFTGGGYVPDPGLSMEDHVDLFKASAEACAICEPRFITTLAGLDAWSLAQNVDFFGALSEIAAGLGLTLSVETHRSRSTFTPWGTRDLLRQLPELKLTCDFSHWCCVAERLVLDGEPEILALCAERAHHIHGRVGYDQGAQVPHPAAPEYRAALEAHERWWDVIWAAQARRGYRQTTMTPEFGPDGYLHTIPFTNMPVADLLEINRWMADRERGRFAARAAEQTGVSPS